MRLNKNRAGKERQQQLITFETGLNTHRPELIQNALDQRHPIPTRVLDAAVEWLKHHAKQPSDRTAFQLIASGQPTQTPTYKVFYAILNHDWPTLKTCALNHGSSAVTNALRFTTAIDEPTHLPQLLNLPNASGYDWHTITGFAIETHAKKCFQALIETKDANKLNPTNSASTLAGTALRYNFFPAADYFLRLLHPNHLQTQLENWRYYASYHENKQPFRDFLTGQGQWGQLLGGLANTPPPPNYPTQMLWLETATEIDNQAIIPVLNWIRPTTIATAIQLTELLPKHKAIAAIWLANWIQQNNARSTPQNTPARHP